MATVTEAPERRASAAVRWYALNPAQVAGGLGVDPDAGLSAGEAAERLRQHGPNALPAEKPRPALLRFLDEYRSYMQLILVGAAVVSLAIQEWSTAALLIAITLLNAVVGLRQEGKAESAMNALKSMMKAIARVRRDGSRRRSTPRSWLSATSSCSPQATRCRPTAASSRRARCRSTRRR